MIVKSILVLLCSIFCCSVLFAEDQIVKRYSNGQSTVVSLDVQRVKASPVERRAMNLTVNGMTFNVTYQDVISGNGIGFDDVTHGSDRRATLEAVLSYIATVLDHTAEIDVNCETSLNSPGSSTLASAGTYYSTLTNGFKGGAAFDRISTGTDPFGGVEDIFVQVNFGKTWNSDLSAPSFGEFDLFTVLLHEISHGLGMTSLIESDGTGGLSNPNVYSTFDEMLEDNSGTQLINPGSFTFQGTLSDLTTGSCFYTGSNATAFEGGNIPIYTPNTFDNGSSIAHWDPSYDVNAIMNPSLASGIQKRTYSGFEVRVLQDLGYTVDLQSDLALDITTTSPATVGTAQTLTITLNNDGPVAASNVTVTLDSFPANTSYVSDDGGGDYVSGTRVWTVASLASGANTTLNIQFTVDEVGTYTFAGEVTASDLSDPDSTVNNGSGSGEDDDDSVSVYSGFTLSKTTVTVDEDLSTEDFTVVLNADPGGTPVVIRMTEDDTDDSEITINGGAGPVDLTFTTSNWDDVQTVTIAGLDDSVLDGTKAITITFAVQSGPTAFQALPNQTLIASNADDGESSFIFSDEIVINGSTTKVNVSSFTYSVSSSDDLSTGSSDGTNWDVTIPLDVDGSGDATIRFDHGGGNDSVPFNITETTVPIGGG